MREWIFYAGAAGIVGGIWVETLATGWRLDVWFLVLLGVTLLMVALRSRNVTSVSYVLLIAVFCLAVALGTSRTQLFESGLTSQVVVGVGEEVTVTGVVIQEPDVRAFNTQLYVRTSEAIVLVFTDRYQAVAYGDWVRATGTLTQPTSFETDLGRTFDYPGYLASRQVTHLLRYAEVEVMESGVGNPVISQLLALKAAFLQQIETHLPEPQAGLAEGLLLGVKRALGDDLENAFRSTGIIHIVVLSGYNIMLVVAFTLYVLAFVLPWRGRLVFGIAAIVAFALIVGLSATVVRASIMAVLALIARGFGRTYTVARALLVAGLIMLLINPYLLVYDVGFQLSFLATLGLILVAPLLEARFTLIPTYLGVREFLIATLATQVFVLPILLYQIGEFSVVAVLVNVLVLPMVPVAMLATFLMATLSFIMPVLVIPLAWVAYVALTYIVVIPTWFASLPFASFVVPAFPFWLVVVAYAALAYGLYRWYRPVTQSTKTAGWTIVEESALLESLQTSNKDKTEPPVFFR